MVSLIANWGESELNRARRLLKKRLREDHAQPDDAWVKTVRYQFPGNPIHLLTELFKDLMKEPEFTSLVGSAPAAAPAAAPAVATAPAASVTASWSTDDDDFIRSLIEESNGKLEPKVIDAACALFPTRTRAQVEDRFKLMAVTPLVAQKEHRVGRMENNYSDEERKLFRDTVIEHYNPAMSYRHFTVTYIAPLFKERSESGLVQRVAKVVTQLKAQGYKFPVPKGFVPKSAKAEQSRLPEPPAETPPAPGSGRALPRLLEPNVDYQAVIVRVKDNGLVVDVTVNENRIYQGYVPESQIWHHAHHYLLDDWFDEGDWVTVRYYGRNPNTTLGQLPPGDKRISGGYLFSIKAANASPVVPKQRTPMPEIAHEEPPTPTPPPVAEPDAPAQAPAPTPEPASEPASEPTPPPITATAEPAAVAIALRVGDRRPPLAPAVEHIQRLAKELSDQVVGMAARLTQSEDVIGEALAAIERFDVAHARELLRTFKGDAQA